MTEGVENHVLFPYDGDFFGAYGDFLDEVDKIADKFNLNDEDRQTLFSFCGVAVHVDIMINEACGDTSRTESFMDDVGGSLDDDTASAFLDEVVNFHNIPIRPNAFDTLRLIQAQSEGFVLTEVTAAREEDSVIYTFVNFGE